MNFSEADKEIYLSNLSARDIIDSLTLEDVKNFLESLGVEQIMVNEEKGHIVCPTICHNPIGEAESMKLYWYQNNKIFRCYTECNEAMSIFELYKRYMELNEYPITIDEAKDYVKNFLQHIITHTRNKKQCEVDINRYKYDAYIPCLPEIPESVLDCFTKYYHPQWLKDGITPEAMDKFNIRFSISQNKIIIPHYDIEGKLIGIRGRTIDKEEAIEFGKYRPVQIGENIYTHPLQFNLYGIYEHKDAIVKRRSAIIVEGEKSVLLDQGYYGKWSNTVACCGSTFNKYHISLLTNILGASEIIVALDKEYETWNDSRAKIWRKKIMDLCNKYKNQANFSYIWDFDNVLNEKDSPFDKGKEIFEHLYKNRVKVR